MLTTARAGDAGLGLAKRFSRFVVVALQPFTGRNVERFGAGWLLEHGCAVELIDLSRLAWRVEAVESAVDTPKNVHRPESWSVVEALVADRPDQTLWILGIDPLPNALPFFELLEKYRPRTLYFDSGRLPIPGRRLPGIGPTLRTWGASIAKRLVAARALSERGQAGQHVSVDYYVMSGRDCEMNPPAWLGSAGSFVPAHAYDWVLWDAAQPFAHDRPYAVFLDQAFPDHKDYARLGVANPFDRDDYYQRVRRFLGDAARAFDMPVLVALHPRSRGSDGEDPYPWLPAYRDQTAALVKGAALVIAHDTTAISFAILSRKPLVLVDYDERGRTLSAPVLHRMAALLATPVVHMHSPQFPRVEGLRVAERRYARYAHNYIRHPACPGVPVWDRVFADGLQRK